MNLSAADIINDCRFVPPDQPYVEIPHSLFYTSPLLNLGDIRLNERQPCPGNGIFICTGILCVMPPSPGGLEPLNTTPQLSGIAYIRFRWPNGRYTSNVRVNQNFVYNPFNFPAPGGNPGQVENGSTRLNKPLRITPVALAPGSDIGIEVENRASTNQAPIVVQVEFRGKLRVFIKNGQ